MLENELYVFPVIIIIDGRIDAIELLLLILLLLDLPSLPMLFEPLLQLLLADHLAEVVPGLGGKALLVHIQVYIINLRQHSISASYG